MNIGFIAHESKKKLLQNFCIAYRGILSKHQFYATGTSGRLIEEATNLDVHKLHAGHVGGEQQMASMIEQNQMDLVIFLCGPYQEKNMNRMHIRFSVYVIHILFRWQQILPQRNF